MKKKYGASITVEAAFVVPVIIYTIFALMYFSFYLHDIITVESKVNKWVYRTACNIKHPVDLINDDIIYESINDPGVFYYLKGDLDIEAEDLRMLLQEELSKDLFILTVKEINTEINPFVVRVKVLTQLNISLNPVKSILGKEMVKTFETSQDVHNPSEFIRICNAITETIDTKNSLDQLNEKLTELLNSLIYKKN